MIYLLIAIFIILIFVAIILNDISDKEKKANNFLEELAIETKEIKHTIDEYKNKQVQKSNKKIIKKIDANYSSKSYMENLYGYIEQTKLFWMKQILAEIEKLPYTDNTDFIKRYYLLMFARMMEESNLNFSDFKIEHTYGGAGPSAHYYIDFELKDAKYYGFDEWVSKATLVIKMKNGELREFEVEGYVNNLEDYFQTNSEYEKVHFFDALDKVYGQFSFDGESYKTIGGYKNKKYTLVINDLVQQYINVGKKWNICFDTSICNVIDLPWNGNLENVLEKTAIINNSWSVDTYVDIEILDFISVQKRREEMFNTLLKSDKEDDKFKLATMYYYGQYDWDYRKEDGYSQQQAIKIWKELAEKGHSYSQLVLGILYYDGIYLLKNLSKAKEYIELAYENGFEKPAKKVWDELNLDNS